MTSREIKLCPSVLHLTLSPATPQQHAVPPDGFMTGMTLGEFCCYNEGTVHRRVHDMVLQSLPELRF